MIITRLALPLLVCMAVVAAPGAARADQQYSVSGSDSYQIGARELQTQISYSGRESLVVTRYGKAKRYRAQVRYRRSDRAGTLPGQASFEATLLPSGEQRDEANRDPNYLTVLNQPFSVQLDVATLTDLSRLHGRIPFDFPSPMTGGALHGYLKRGTAAVLGGRRAIGVDFEAEGPMRGPLPDHPSMTLNGKMHMHGVAYYESSTALLVALDATLRIDGVLEDPKKETPVSIVYRRVIRAESPSSALKEASAH